MRRLPLLLVLYCVTACTGAVSVAESFMDYDRERFTNSLWFSEGAADGVHLYH